ncbi:MAG: RsmB/NOP family class I SAM-dependent RNA methyltransferase [Candidatus Accumulibacter sp.]|jgi:16S rRNA (cytosine967-C5)-methyltransferase|nr:RsmB/NOP family class I SAM-dependent RNA methyltransferase [Accumulibacter sp.]
MRLTPALLGHTELLLTELLHSPFAADSVVSRHFRQHRELGHNDRAFAAETVYAVLRRKRSLSACCFGEITARRLVLAALSLVQGLNRRELEPVIDAAEAEWLARAKAVRFDELPAAVRLDLPDWLHEALSSQYAADELQKLVDGLNQAAPLDLRVNEMKAGRDAVLSALRAEGIDADVCRFSPLGIRLIGKPFLSRHPLFLDGSVEVQDEGSQLLGFLLQPKRGEMVADFCAGAGGKTLLLGAMMRSRGRLYAFDVAEKRLTRLKPRLKRSGLSNVYPARIDSEHDIKIKRLAGKLDRVLVDAPCSGLGTLRRNPDLKWRQGPEGIAELIDKQASILRAAAGLVKPGGRLVYATCSLLDGENDGVVDGFLASHPEFAPVSAGEILRGQGIAVDTGARLRLAPHRHGTDGFFAVVVVRGQSLERTEDR